MNADGSGGGALARSALADAVPPGRRTARRRVRQPDGGRRPLPLFVMNADGTDDQQLTGVGDAADDFAVVDPDGARIAFSGTRPGGFPQIFVVPPTGTL